MRFVVLNERAQGEITHADSFLQNFNRSNLVSKAERTGSCGVCNWSLNSLEIQMYWVLAIGSFVSIMFGWGGYQALDGRMVGRPWLFIRAGVWQVAIGAIVVATGHTLVHTLYPRLIELSGVAENMVMGVASSFAGALFGMGVAVKATNLRAEDVRRIDRQKAFVDELKEMLKASSEEEKNKVIHAFLMERRELVENAKRAAIDLD